MRFRLRTAEELTTLYGLDFNRRGVCINSDMQNYLGQPIEDNYLRHLSESDLQSEWARFEWKHWDWETWMITENITSDKRLFSVDFIKHLRKCKDVLAQKLLEVAYNPREKEHIKNLSLKKEGVVTYCPAHKEPSLSSANKWLKKGRQEGRIGRVLSKVCKDFNIEYTDSDMEQLVNYLKASVSGGEFITIDGDDILEYYHERSYQFDDNIGTLANSCMRHDKCQDYFDIYTKNTEVCRMLLLKEANGKITGRALIWKTDKGIFMDRIYASDSNIKKFINYAKQNGWLYKSRQAADCQLGVIDDGVEKDLVMTVQLSTFDFDKYPYLDTFRYASNNNVITNLYDNAEIGVMDFTDGFMRHTRKCYVDGRIYDKDNCIETKTSTGETVWAYMSNAFQCNIDNNYYLQECVVDTLSRGYVHKENNIDKIEYLDSEGYYDFKDSIFTCAYDNQKYSVMNKDRWSSQKKMVKIKLNDMNVTLHEKNVVSYLSNKGYSVLDDVVISPSLSRELNLNL